MSKQLKELERRLRDEPDNLPLRVTVAGAMREAGRGSEAVELYRSVAIAYRDQGRTKQAVAVCKSLLEIAPNDPRCQELLATLEASTPKPKPAPPELPKPRIPISAEPPGPQPPRRPEILIPIGGIDETPLPQPTPYHVYDPTSSRVRKISKSELSIDDTGGSGSEEALTDPERVSDHRSSTTDTRRRLRISTAEMRKLDPIEAAATARFIASDDSTNRILVPDGDETTPVSRVPDSDDEPDEPPRLPTPRLGSPVVQSTDTEDELTQPHAVDGTPLVLKRSAVDPFSTSFFSYLPIERRSAALSRFHRRTIKAGETIFARGATGHPFVLVLKGQLEVRRERRAPYTVGPGEYAGEDSLLARGPAMSTVVALGESNVLLLLPADFYEIVGGFPALWAELKDTVATRNRS